MFPVRTWTDFPFDWPASVSNIFRPANLENVFRGTFRVKKRDLPAKSGTVGRAHIEIFLKVYSLQKSIAFQNTLWHGDSAAVPFGIFARNETEFP